MKYKLGRLPAKRVAKLRLATYLSAALPTPPAGPLGRVAQLTQDIGEMYGNDQYGDCTIAAKGHLIGAFTGLVNPPSVLYSTQQMVDDYLRLTGGQDTGLDLITVLEDWEANGGTLGHPIAGYASVDAKNQLHLQFAIWQLYNTYVGLNLPDEIVNNMPTANGFVWDVCGAADPSNGHCVCAIDYTTQGLVILSWGMWGTMTWAAAKQYLVAADGGEAHVVLTKDILAAATQESPNSVNWAALSADLTAVGKLES